MKEKRNFSKRGTEDYNWVTSLFQAFVRTFILYPFFILFYKVKVEGFKNIPHDRPILVAANHLSYLDPPLIAAVMKRNLAYMAKKELFEVPVLSFLIWHLGAFAVNREKLEVSTIKTAKAVLSNKHWTMALFPQGKRVRNGCLGHVSKGFASLAKISKTDILPIGLTGIQNTAKWPFQGNATVRIGTPISYDLEIEEIEKQWSEQICKLAELKPVENPEELNTPPVPANV